MHFPAHVPWCSVIPVATQSGPAQDPMPEATCQCFPPYTMICQPFLLPSLTFERSIVLPSTFYLLLCPLPSSFSKPGCGKKRRSNGRKQADRDGCPPPICCLRWLLLLTSWVSSPCTQWMIFMVRVFHTTTCPSAFQQNRHHKKRKYPNILDLHYMLSEFQACIHLLSLLVYPVLLSYDRTCSHSLSSWDQEQTIGLREEQGIPHSIRGKQKGQTKDRISPD